MKFSYVLLASLAFMVFTSCVKDEERDDDNDGFTELQGDCDDTNPNINPNATEICGDGIDQDCDGKDLACPTNYYLHEDGLLSTSPVAEGLITHYIYPDSPREWIISLTEDLEGGDYGYVMWTWAYGRSLKLDIVLNHAGNETILASWDNLTTYDAGHYVELTGTQTGEDFSSDTGDLLMVRITNTSSPGDRVSIRYSFILQSCIWIGPSIE